MFLYISLTSTDSQPQLLHWIDYKLVFKYRIRNAFWYTEGAEIVSNNSVTWLISNSTHSTN